MSSAPLGGGPPSHLPAMVGASSAAAAAAAAAAVAASTTTTKPAKAPRRSGGNTKKQGGRGSGSAAAAAAIAARAGNAANAAHASAVAAAVGSSSAATSASAPSLPPSGAKDGAGKDAAADAAKDSKEHHSRSYPRGVGLDFRKLAGLTLLNYIDHHGVPVRPEAPPSELAVAVARHFEAMEIDEEECIGGFLERLEVGVGCTAGKTNPTDYSRSTGYFDGYQMPLTVRKRQRSKLAARPGEQVAAKVTRTDDNGSWILASVQRFYNDTETYDVQDEDDTSKLIRLPWNHVMRLSMGGEGVFNKGTDCMAIFPETTSFYRARVSKQPVWKMDTSKGMSTPVVKEMIVKFEDDEDDTTGKTPHRRVPARYVIPLPANYFYDELDDVDLSLALPNNGNNSKTAISNNNNGTSINNPHAASTANTAAT